MTREYKMTKTKVVAAIVTAAAIATTSAHGHGYLSCPRPRQVVAAQCGVWYAPTSNNFDASIVPAIETCPHCLNKAGPNTDLFPGAGNGICGITQDGTRDFTNPPDYNGNAFTNTIQAVYNEGETIQIDSVITAHHRGHVEMYACEMAIPTFDCFESNPLEFVEDLYYGASKDPTYKHRAYIPDTEDPGSYDVSVDGTSGLPLGMNLSHRFKLPTGMHGTVKLLWKYVTANSCNPVGYSAYFAQQSMTGKQAWWQANLPVCADPLPFTGAPEQFWNCVDVCVNPTTGTKTCPNISGAVCGKTSANNANASQPWQAVQACIGNGGAVSNVDGFNSNGGGDNTNGNGDTPNNDGDQPNGNGDTPNNDGDQPNDNGDTPNNDGDNNSVNLNEGNNDDASSNAGTVAGAVVGGVLAIGLIATVIGAVIVVKRRQTQNAAKSQQLKGNQQADCPEVVTVASIASPTQAGQLPHGWQEKWDTHQRAQYYYNAHTHVSQWERPI